MKALYVIEKTHRVELLGIGLYSVSDAARLLRPKFGKASPQNIRRWVDGHKYQYRGKVRRARPLWRPELPRIGGQIGLGFRDLMELRFVASFRDAGLSLQAIRMALERASEIVGHDHPFATERIRTDGREMFLELADRTGEPTLIALCRNQYSIHRMIAPSFKDIEFEHGIAARWWPLGQRKRVVLDPARSFGKPIDDASGVPVDALSAAAETLGSVREAARWYGVDPGAVRTARDFTSGYAV